MTETGYGRAELWLIAQADFSSEIFAERFEPCMITRDHGTLCKLTFHNGFMVVHGVQFMAAHGRSQRFTAGHEGSR